jgi:multiple sugar transport system ATP-binding protein
MPSLTLDGLARSFSRTAVGLHPVSLHLPDGDCLAVVGPSGAGKSTLLRLIAGLDRPTAGRILFDGRDVTRLPPHRRGVAWVPQRPALYPHLTVERNLAIGLEMQERTPAADVAARVREAAEWLGLTPLLARRPHELSGGEQQRVVLGRAVVRRAAVWLLDEPFSHLDPVLRAQFRTILPLLQRRNGVTIIHVTHDPAEAFALGQRLAVLDRGQLAQEGTPADVWDHPNRASVAELLAGLPTTRLDGTVERHPSGWRFRGPSGTPDWVLPVSPEKSWHDGQRLTAVVRPTEAAVAEPATDAPACVGGLTVARHERHPAGWLVVLTGRGQDWRAWWPAEAGPPPELGRPASWHARRVHWFDGQTGQTTGVG